MMMPVAMPEAVAGWFKPIRLETCGRWRYFWVLGNAIAKAPACLGGLWVLSTSLFC